MRKQKSEATTYRVVKLGEDFKRVFSEKEWQSLSPDDQAQYETVRAGIATKEEAEATIRPTPRPAKRGIRPTLRPSARRRARK